jgi:hypothetical protein
MKVLLVLLSSLIMTNCASSNLTKENQTFEELILAGKDIFIEGQTFDKDIDFTQFEKTLISDGIQQVRIVSAISFKNCTFNGKVIAYDKGEEGISTITAFQSSLSFTGCTFNEEVNFKASSVLGRTDFTKAAFFNTANFEECTFVQNAYFRGAIYHKELRFQHTVFMQKANFLNSECDETASFQKAVFNGETQFSSSRFMGYTDFGNISCSGDFLANFTEFADRVIFNNSFFYRRTDLNNVSFNYCEIKNCSFIGESRFVESKVNKQIFFEDCKFFTGIPDFNSFDTNKLSTKGLSN